MAKYIRVHDHDAHFRGLNFTPWILNDIPAKTKEEREALDALIKTTYNNTDTLDPIPTCACGELAYGYNLGRYCPKCKTRVEKLTDADIESTVWFRAPESTAGLINPLLWIMISNHLMKSKFDILHWFCNPYADDPHPKQTAVHGIIKKLMAVGVPRGYNSFIQNFDKLSPTICQQGNTSSQRKNLAAFLAENRNKLFPEHLPIPSKIAFVLEKTPTGPYADVNIKDPINACLTITSLDSESKKNPKRMEAKITSVIMDLSNYYDYVLRKIISPKHGLLRKNIFSSRMGYSFRVVITSDHGVHDYETIKLPYTQAVSLLKVHLLNKLDKLGYSERAAKLYVAENTKKRDPLLLRLLNELIAETPNGEGIWTLFIRYPVLNRNSIQALRINRISEYSSSLSVLCLVGCNGDKEVLSYGY